MFASINRTFIIIGIPTIVISLEYGASLVFAVTIGSVIGAISAIAMAILFVVYFHGYFRCVFSMKNIPPVVKAPNAVKTRNGLLARVP